MDSSAAVKPYYSLADQAASKLEGQKSLGLIFAASMAPFETAARKRKHFRMGQRFWTLIVPG
jgi:hypothetical protein